MNLRDVANILLDRLSRGSLRLRLIVQRVFRLTHAYQPSPFVSDMQLDPRACRKRFCAASAALNDIKAPSVLDIGCNQGYFSFRFAELGGVCIGIDNDRSELMAARALAEINKVRNVAFLEITLDETNIGGLPTSDIVICLSVFHHWVRHYGEVKAINMLAMLSKKANMALIFDSGQPEEVSTTWAKELSFMTPSGPIWIAQHLADLGFVDVQEVGSFSTTLSEIPRSLFVARRSF